MLTPRCIVHSVVRSPLHYRIADKFSATEQIHRMRISPKKLLLSKWTALTPIKREKHFLVTRVIVPDEGAPITEVELQAVHSGRTQTIAWKMLEDAATWVVGWK
jgi:tryptophan-rich hypothetical protein